MMQELAAPPSSTIRKLCDLACRLGFGGVDFDATLEMGAVLDADARGINVPDDGAVLLDVNTAARVDVADNFSVGDDFASMNFGSELSGGADGEFVTLEDGEVDNDETLKWLAASAVDDAVNLQVFGTGDLTLDLDAGAEARTTAGRSAAEFS